MNRAILLVALAGCAADPAADPQPDAGVVDDGRLTLDNCPTSIDADVPAFYAKYFRCSTITVESGAVVLRSSSLPPHATYYYGAGDPNYAAWDDRGGAYSPNPHLLTAQELAVAIPANPTPKGVTITEDLVDGVAQTDPAFELPGGPVGMALDGVALFDGLAAPGMSIETERFTFDAYNAHPAPDTTYHYHTTMPGSLEVLAHLGMVTSTTPGDAELEVYGVLCDGTVILGCTELDGAAPSGALDAQGGHVGDLVDDDGTTHFTARYHTHVCPGGHEYTPEIQYYTTCARP